MVLDLCLTRNSSIYSAPVAAMGVLFFMEYKVFETDYFNNFYQSREIPMPFAIIDEIAEKHPLARSKIFELVKRGLTHKFRLEVIQVVCYFTSTKTKGMLKKMLCYR